MIWFECETIIFSNVIYTHQSQVLIVKTLLDVDLCVDESFSLFVIVLTAFAGHFFRDWISSGGMNSTICSFTHWRCKTDWYHIEQTRLNSDLKCRRHGAVVLITSLLIDESTTISLSLPWNLKENKQWGRINIVQYKQLGWYN